jgi:hypothetical protein
MLEAKLDMTIRIAPACPARHNKTSFKRLTPFQEISDAQSS